MIAKNYKVEYVEGSRVGKPNDGEHTDIDLWKAFKKGSNSAFLKIYENYFDSLYRFGSRITTREELVKDAIHDVFLDLRKYSETIGDTHHIKFYLFKCLKRRIIKELNKWSSRQSNLNEHTPFEVTISHEQFLINSQLDQEQFNNIQSALDGLSPRKREAIYYLFYEGMSYEEISEMMSLSNPKSARDLVYKALRSLRNSLGFIPLFFQLTNA
ncbi:RNA polymerase sigma factor [Echinicola salinicaeni]|uniref:RNA polymerase sigma factor n=1 Tax=Echinicola salinicaeni TaxID=2762757 RepID=UPI0016492D97|nr:sigma-70 family RNA polymerase sigma factor [Echinicola salinicaeni]